MNKQQLASKIWESANKMRSKIEANEYKDYILGFIFYKYLSNYELRYLEKQGYGDDDIREQVNELNTDVVEDIQNNIGYFIAYENLFSTWLELGHSFSISHVSEALSAFSRLIHKDYKRVFDRIFQTLETGLSKLGENVKSQTQSVSSLIYLINEIPMDGVQDYDVLGFIYEYLISNFAANAGKKAGEFYTPHEVSLLMSEIVAQSLMDRSHRELDKLAVYDPTSGSGSLLINIGRAVAKRTGNSDGIMYYAQELKENTYNLTRMNLVMRGIKAAMIETRNGDTLEEDWPAESNADRPLYVDAVVSNPPYSQQWNPEHKENDSRYKSFGLAPKGTADYAFLLHDLYHLKPDGIMTIVLPHGVLFRGGQEGQIRKNLIERNHIDAIIGLPANIFFGTGIPTIIMVLRQKRTERNDVLIIDASKGFEKVGKNNRLRACDIKKIADVVAQRAEVEKFSRVVSREEIRDNDYNLNIPRYVDSSETPESWDIYASMFGGVPTSEIAELHDYWSAFPGLQDSLFSLTNESYASLRVADVKGAIASHKSVKAFNERYLSAFDGFDQILRQELVQGAESVNVSGEEERLSAEVFHRLEGIPLVDRYEAYQLLHDVWTQIAGDLEIIQTEGFAATKQVDPNMVVKKKNKQDVEVQEGWVGHILPFELVQRHKLGEALAKLRDYDARLAEIDAAYTEAFEALTEEEKEALFVNDDKTDFVEKEVKAAIKAQTVEPETLAILRQVDAHKTEEKKLKKQSKDLAEALHKETKAVIEGLSDDDVRTILYDKWIVPLLQTLAQLPNDIVANFSTKVVKLAAKYETTLSEVEEQIEQTEKELAEMIGQLTGNQFDMQGLDELKKMLGDC